MTTPLRTLRMLTSRGKVELTLMTDRIIRRVRRREVARVSRTGAECCNASFRVRQGLRHSVVRDTRVPRRGCRRPSAGTRHREHLPAEPGIPAIARQGRQMRTASWAPDREPHMAGGPREVELAICWVSAHGTTRCRHHEPDPIRETQRTRSLPLSQGLARAPADSPGPDL